MLPALENPPLRAAVITLSDKGSRGEREDKSGPLIVQMLTAAGYRQATPSRQALMSSFIVHRAFRGST